jgi:tetratricopeptide (TPR) repeat protein
MIAQFSINSNRTFVPALLAAWLIVCLVPLSLIADESNAWTVQKINESKPWDALVGGPKVRVEGRMSASSGNQFRLQNCEIAFSVEKQKLQAIPVKSYVEIRGQFKKDGSKIVFAVDEMKIVSRYSQQYALKASRLQHPTPKDWIELGDWVSERAKFYEDPELAKLASDAYSKSIDVEYRALKATNAEGRFELAKKVADFGLPDRRRMELVHEGCRIEWQNVQKADPPDIAVWQQFAFSLIEKLPGADVPLKKEDLVLKESYNREPDLTYRKAKDDMRPKLHRLFYIAVTLKFVLYGASDDGRDGDAIADQIEKLIPEESELAETHRLKRLEYGLKNITTANRIEAEKLATAFQERHQNETAKRALTEWIKAHESRLKGDGIVGLLQLADEYLTLLNNRQAAVECLLEANKIDPKFEDVKQKLFALGYQWHEGRWVKSGIGERQIVESQSATGISVGMTASSLRSVLGQPRSLARAMTARGITEIWSFGTAGSTPLVIRLEQQGGDREPKITALSGEH